MKRLDPKILWTYFHEITQVPRPSKKEEKIRAYVEAFAKSHKLDYKSDKAGNILISKPATEGYEEKGCIILQAHMDMVCEKNSDVDFNFDTDPIESYIDGEWLKAKGTTLGADNGIGMAMMMAVLTDIDLVHPALECLFTVDEETGLTGAFELEKDFLSGKTLINLDSEDDGEIFVGCAGGIDSIGRLSYQAESYPVNYFSFKIKVSGLKGGHSGDDINKELGNSNKILNRFLWSVNRKMDLRLGSFDGGNLRNAIPREASAIACVPANEKESLQNDFEKFVADMKIEKGTAEPDMKITLESCAAPETVIDKKSSEALFNALYACPHGVIAMSLDVEGLVETSNNLASVKMKEGNIIEITTSQRSSIESAKYDIANQVRAALELGGAVVTQGDGYPGWKPNLDSAILKAAEESYERLFGEKAKVRAIHAGLECGLFLEKYPELDMISIGPTMRGVHSPEERLHIPSTQKCWDWLIEILAD